MCCLKYMLFMEDWHNWITRMAFKNNSKTLEKFRDNHILSVSMCLFHTPLSQCSGQDGSRWKFWATRIVQVKILATGIVPVKFFEKMPSRCLFLATGMSRWEILEKYAIPVHFFGDRDVPVKNFVKKSIPVIIFVPSQ